MDTSADRCKSCGIIFIDVDQEIDKCMKKRLYCELCLAQKNPVSETEQRIKKKYILITALFAFILLTLLIVANWGGNKNDNLLEYFIGFGVGYLIIWALTALLSVPVLMIMKKPHRGQINQEKEKYSDGIAVKKKARKALQEKQKELASAQK